MRLSSEGRLLLFEIKEGGERSGRFALLDVESRRILPDILNRGYLRGFQFTADGKGFYYVHEPLESRRPHHHAAYRHILGTAFSDDTEIFSAGEDPRLRLTLIAGNNLLGFLVQRRLPENFADLYIWSPGEKSAPSLVLTTSGYSLGPILRDGQIFAITNRDAPNRRIVRIEIGKSAEPKFLEIVPECDTPICGWLLSKTHVYVSYVRETSTEVRVFDLSGQPAGQIPVGPDESIRLVTASDQDDQTFFEAESFSEPIHIDRYSATSTERSLWAQRKVPFTPENHCHRKIWYPSRDGTLIPMFLVGREDVVAKGPRPAIMTAYGGFGLSMTPGFGVLVAFLLERGCLLAVPNIRGGSEFGTNWHVAARCRNRQTAYDDFLSAALWLIETGRTTADRLGIFGGSNSGLLVGAALTQRPDLFRAALCMVPILDMLRYHLFDTAWLWRNEFGTADDPDDFSVLREYSPYHRVEQGASYPATLIVSGHADANCNPMHARKMTARLQAANGSAHPILLDYNLHRGHSAVLPLGERIEALTDRVAFFAEHLGVPL
jgi:prolyl oligopeptidase